LDAASPPPAVPPADPSAYVYAAADLGPRQSRERDLCERASHTDWLYIGTTFAGIVGSVAAETQYFKHLETPGVRLMGPSFIGLFWGAFLGGGYLSLPKCDPQFAPGPAPEGSERSSAPVAIAIALAAGITAPAFAFGASGPGKFDWPVWERSTRVLLPIGTGILGALLPYALPPRTWAAKKEIEKIRGGPTAGGGAMFTYTVAF
jgi:hypothetical protein